MNSRLGDAIGEDLIGEVGRLLIEELSTGDVLLIGRDVKQEGSSENTGRVFTMDSETGKISGAPYAGKAANDLEWVDVHEAKDGSFYVLNLLYARNHGLDDAGKIVVVRPVATP